MHLLLLDRYPVPQNRLFLLHLQYRMCHHVHRHQSQMLQGLKGSLLCLGPSTDLEEYHLLLHQDFGVRNVGETHQQQVDLAHRHQTHYDEWVAVVA
jgi:hypothetical protein